MRSFILSKNAALKIRRDNFELYGKDFETKMLGLYPGEFVILEDEVINAKYLAHCFSVDPKYPLIKIHEKIETLETVEENITSNLFKALNYRRNFISYKDNFRLVFGASDRLPGMVIDCYENAVSVTLSTCAYDPYVDVIKDFIVKNFNKTIHFRTKNSERLKYGQPQSELQTQLEEIEAIENDLKYVISSDVFQKNGFYFDHRDNRSRAVNTIKKMKLRPMKGLDLFSYLGAWGMNLLSSGVCSEMKFIDQADLESSFLKNLAINNLSEKGEFLRKDVFEFLNSANQEQKYDLICCDPPAFAKSMSAKKSALVGYRKLHTKCLSLLAENGIYIAASCTHYVTIDEFQNSVFESATSLGKKIKMLDIGIQSADHCFSHFDSKQNYIKYLLYLVE